MTIWFTVFAGEDETRFRVADAPRLEYLHQQVGDGDRALLFVLRLETQVNVLGDCVRLPFEVHISPADELRLLLPRSRAQHEVEEVGIVNGCALKYLP